MSMDKHLYLIIIEPGEIDPTVYENSIGAAIDEYTNKYSIYCLNRTEPKAVEDGMLEDYAIRAHNSPRRIGESLEEYWDRLKIEPKGGGA